MYNLIIFLNITKLFQRRNNRGIHIDIETTHKYITPKHMTVMLPLQLWRGYKLSSSHYHQDREGITWA